MGIGSTIPSLILNRTTAITIMQERCDKRTAKTTNDSIVPRFIVGWRLVEIKGGAVEVVVVTRRKNRNQNQRSGREWHEGVQNQFRPRRPHPVVLHHPHPLFPLFRILRCRPLLSPSIIELLSLHRFD
jgi:hypothetical protein